MGRGIRGGRTGSPYKHSMDVPHVRTFVLESNVRTFAIRAAERFECTSFERMGARATGTDQGGIAGIRVVFEASTAQGNFYIEVFNNKGGGG